MTEDEAKTKWCPMVRHEGDENGSFNRGNPGDEINDHDKNRGTLCNCIASDCMMWVVDTPKGSSRSEGMTVNSTHEYGHCGLAK